MNCTQVTVLTNHQNNNECEDYVTYDYSNEISELIVDNSNKLIFSEYEYTLRRFVDGNIKWETSFKFHDHTWCKTTINLIISLEKTIIYMCASDSCSYFLNYDNGHIEKNNIYDFFQTLPEKTSSFAFKNITFNNNIDFCIDDETIIKVVNTAKIKKSYYTISCFTISRVTNGNTIWSKCIEFKDHTLSDYNKISFIELPTQQYIHFSPGYYIMNNLFDYENGNLCN